MFVTSISAARPSNIGREWRLATVGRGTWPKAALLDGGTVTVEGGGPVDRDAVADAVERAGFRLTD